MEKYNIEKDLLLYRLREIENEDMRLKIEELRLGEEIGTINYDEKIQTSIKCKNNDSVMNKIETLEKKIRINEIANKRVDNILSMLEPHEKEVIEMVFIEKKSISQTANELYKNRKSIKNTITKAFERFNEIYK